MKKFIFILIVCFLLFPCGPLFSLTKPTVVVVGFDITVPGLQYEQTLPNALTDLMINALINSNRFRVFERRKLENLVTEQGFQYFSGIVDPSTAVQLGKMVGAHFVVTGSVTGISSGGREGVRVGPVKIGSGATLVTLTVRIVDVQTGEILYSEVKQEKASRSTVGLAIGSLDVYSQESQDIISAVNVACEEIVTTFVERMDEGIGEFASRPIEGYVVQVSGNTIYLNLGRDSGIKVGDLVRIFHPGEAIVDPKTGEVLDQELIFVAEARVGKVKERVSEAIVTRKQGDVVSEDIVEVVGGEESSSLYEEKALALYDEDVWGEGSIEEEIPEEEGGASLQVVFLPEENEISPFEEAGEGTVFEGVAVSYYREFYPGGELKLEYTYYIEEGKKVEHGIFTKWYDNGQIMIQGTYRHGKKDGVWRECLRNGVPKTEGTYKEGVKEGLWVIFYPGGKKHFEGMYHNDQRDGEWIEYGGDGSVFARTVYEKGRVVEEN